MTPASVPEHWAWFNHRAPDYDRVWRQRMGMLARIRSGAVDLAGLKGFYKDNPVAFLCDWGCTFDPRNIERDLPAVIPFVLFPRQGACAAWMVDRWRAREHGLIEKSRDMGISWLCVGLAAWFWTFFDAMVVGFGSRKEEYVDALDDPKSLFWKLRQFVELLPVELRPAGFDARKHAPYMKLVNPEHGAAVVGEAGTNIGRGARAGIYFVDEAAFLERAAVVDAALSQSTNCQIHLSTVNGPGNPFYQKRHGGRWPVFVFDWRDDPRKDEAWYAREKARLEPEVVAQAMYTVDAGVQLAQFDAMAAAHASQAEMSRVGGKWVSAISALVRPGVTYGVFAFYVACRAAGLVLAFQQGGDWRGVLATAWTADDMAVLMLVLTFWFTGRAWESKQFNR